MAFELKKRSEVTDDIDDVDTHEVRLRDAREKTFINGDRITQESIASAIEEFETTMATGTQDERLMYYSRMHVQRGVSTYLIGKGLIEEENKMKAGNSVYGSLNEMYIENEKLLPFSMRSMYEYIKSAQTVTIEQFKELGAKRTLAVAQVRDEKKREQIIKKVIDNNITPEETRKLVDDYVEKEKTKRSREVVAKKEEAFEEVTYSVTKSGSTSVMIATDRKYVEALQNVILADEARLKIKIYEEYKKLTGR